MCLWMTGSVHGLEHKDWSLLPFGGAAEENDYVLPILGKLAHLSELRFLPHFSDRKKNTYPAVLV